MHTCEFKIVFGSAMVCPERLFLLWRFLTPLVYFFICQYPVLVKPNALKDAPKPAKGATPTTKDVGSGWVIFQQSVSWTTGLNLCEKNYKRLATLPTKEKAQELVDAIAGISEAYTEAYDKKWKEVEFGMDRRYWIGLQDLGQNGSWIWASSLETDVVELDYDFWYPGQPDHANKTEHCVTLWNPAYFNGEKHSFNDENCDNLRYPICDK